MASVVTLADNSRIFADNEKFVVEELVIERGLLKCPHEKIEISKESQIRKVMVPSNESSTQLLKQFLGIKGRTRKSKDEEEEVAVVAKDDSSDTDESSSEEEDESDYSDDESNKNDDSDS